MITCIKITLSYAGKRQKEGRRVNALFGDIDLLRSFQRFALLLDSANHLFVSYFVNLNLIVTVELELYICKIIPCI